jgi:hypothetical protein
VETDFTGVGIISLSEETEYYISVTASGYESFIGTLTPATSDSFNILLTPTLGTEANSVFDKNNVVDNLSYNPNSTNAILTIVVSSVENSIEYFSYVVTYGATEYSGLLEDPSGGIIILNITNINTSLVNTVSAEYSLKTTSFEVYRWDKEYYLEGVIAEFSWEKVFSGLKDADSNKLPIKIVFGGIILLVLMLLVGGASKSLTVASLAGLAGVILNLSLGLFPPSLSVLAIITLVVLLIGDNLNGGGFFG